VGWAVVHKTAAAVAAAADPIVAGPMAVVEGPADMCCLEGIVAGDTVGACSLGAGVGPDSPDSDSLGSDGPGSDSPGAADPVASL
jgi:hypothetical protein